MRRGQTPGPAASLPRPSRRITAAVALTAAAVLVQEVALHRLFSALFFRHYAFLAVATALSGLALGAAAVAARLAPRREAQPAALSSLVGPPSPRALAALALSLSALTLLGLAVLVLAPSIQPFWVPQLGPDAPTPTTGDVLFGAAAFVPSFAAAGALLAVTVTRREAWVAPLYAADLAAAALGTVGAVLSLRAFEGPGVLLAPAALAALVATTLATRQEAPRLRLAARCLLAGLGVALTLLALVPGNPYAPANVGPHRVRAERWDETSRVAVVDHDAFLELVVDRSSSTVLAAMGHRRADQAPQVRAWWDYDPSALAFSSGRPLGRVAVVGVGGGRDLLAPLAHGAQRVDGFEVNQRMVELLSQTYTALGNVARWPEVHLVRAEGRAALRRTPGAYDVVGVNRVATLAGASSGGLALAESGLLTRQGWGTLLAALKPQGVLSFTRRHALGGEPALARLVTLASFALTDAGVSSPAEHVAVFSSQGRASLDRPGQAPVDTVLVSRAPWTRPERRRLLAAARAQHLAIRWLGGAPLGGPSAPRGPLATLLNPQRRDQVIQRSPADLRPPTDDRPFFWLLSRPGDLLLADGDAPTLGADTGAGQEAAERALGVLRDTTAAAACVGLVALLLGVWGARRRPGGPQGAGFVWAVGAGWGLAQLGLTQRLVVALGEPTHAFLAVLGGLLAGAAWGASRSGRLRVTRGEGGCGAGPGLAVAGLVGAATAAAAALGLPGAAAAVEGAPGAGLAAPAAGAFAALMGAGLGLAGPAGVRWARAGGGAAGAGAWALGSAAAVAGAAAAPWLGLTMGAQETVWAGAACYALGAVLVLPSALRRTRA